MTPLVAAVIAVCIGAQCSTHEMHIERRACGASYRAEVPQNGAWVPATVRVQCVPR